MLYVWPVRSIYAALTRKIDGNSFKSTNTILWLLTYRATVRESSFRHMFLYSAYNGGNSGGIHVILFIQMKFFYSHISTEL